MRRTLLLTLSLTLASGGAIAHAATYKTGTYAAGSPTGTGVSLSIKRGSFSVSRVSFTETCINQNGQFDEKFTFVKGSEAKLAGKITSKGKLKGHFESSAGTVDVTGTVKGSTTKLKFEEGGNFTADDGQTYECGAEHSFTAKRR
jgi:DNA uptake protein ComE-like DNA-binding protein